MSPPIPPNFMIGNAKGQGDCFFDSVAQGLTQMRPRKKYSVRSLRQSCAQFATEHITRENWLMDALMAERQNPFRYMNDVQYCADDPPPAIESPIWGRPEIEGRIICQIHNVKIHVIEQQFVENRFIWCHALVDNNGCRSVKHVDYEEKDLITIIKKGDLHFKPVLKANIALTHDQDEEVDLLHKQLRAMEDSNALLSSEVAMLRKQLDEALGTNGSLRHRQEAAESQTSELADENVFLKRKLDNEGTARTMLQTELRELQDSNRNLEKQLLVLGEELVQVRTQMDQKTREGEEKERLLKVYRESRCQCQKLLEQEDEVDTSLNKSLISTHQQNLDTNVTSLPKKQSNSHFVPQMGGQLRFRITVEGFNDATVTDSEPSTVIRL